MARYFITTPIFYVNGAPHIGHLYSALLADVLHRWHRLKHPSSETIFSTGTDEHGLKIQQAAAAANSSIPEFCSNNSQKFRDLFAAVGLSTTHFIRTTEANHIRCVQHAWKVLQERGLIKKGKYAGWYCMADEAFVPDSQLKAVPLENGRTGYVSVDSGRTVEWMKEENYVFPLSQFQDDLKKWAAEQPVFPTIFNNQLEIWLNERELPDLSVSRSSERLKWGIQVPGDPQQKIYVWLDALLNYLTVAGYPDKSATGKWWPADMQVIGKDILKFHAIYWPAFLLGLGLEPPRKVLCHSHWLVDHQKMSKSLGNVVDPFDSIKKYSSDGFRYFLLREGVPHSDSNYSEDKCIKYLNAELAHTLGNLLNRTSSPSVNRTQAFPVQPSTTLISGVLGDRAVTIVSSLETIPCAVDAHYMSANIHQAIDMIMGILRDVNGLVQETQPWVMAKSNEDKDKEKLDCVLWLALESLRVAGVLLQPIVPNLSKELLRRLGLDGSNVMLKDGGISEKLVLPRLEEPVKLQRTKGVLFGTIDIQGRDPNKASA